MIKLNPQRKKQLGVYYTPTPVSELMTRWAVRGPSDTVLEPSFGGCCFIEAIRSRLIDLGTRNPNRSIFGCDIDEDAFEHYLPRAMEFGVPNDQFFEGDFLTQHPGNGTFSKVNVVIGNPPYVSNHNMLGEQRSSSRNVSSFGDFRLSGLASLWAYFVLHGMRFLKPGGRMAWLLPGSATQSDYGRELVHFIRKHFSYVSIISLSEQIFKEEGAEESSEILICEGFSEEELIAAFASYFVEDIGGLRNVLESESKRSSYLSLDFGGALYREISSLPTICDLGSVADVKIGIVTGNNSFFVLNEDQVRTHRLPRSAVHRIFSKSKIAKGLSLNEIDFDISASRGEKMYLVRPTSKSKFLEEYYLGYDAEKRSEVLTFKKRLDWRDPDDGVTPDAFFVYMNQGGPRIVLNDVGCNSTNSIHRIFFKSGIGEKNRMLAALSVVCSVGRLSAEIEGRKYGGGLLKHEPSDVRSLKIFQRLRCDIRNVRRVFSQVSECLTKGDDLEAANLADSFFVKDGLVGISKNRFLECRELYYNLVNRRLRRKDYGFK
ncbi:N-6 DNA methylase [Pelagicoccus sp. SDUM812002]|uniref:HsdM family class I SAM-dependent methyltransferase n=1 Tax=Pelagicoccus sp. SDUM812002 TaxID=3041266 RepID=UPI00280F6C73|nr:N-6 DNA methylase [Pelagicoccus sp. SDUM812002]MDQ8183956.1 N-6 DNA methylase [Pelagicoccus sp. SDUM812002]